MKRRVTLRRVEFGPDYALGVLEIPRDGAAPLRYSTMERSWRGNRGNVSCVPTGDYPCAILSSPRYGLRYHLDPDAILPRTHILFHAGNWPRNTQGCILPGMSAGHLEGERAVLDSTRALREIEAEMGGQPFVLHIVIGYPETGTGAH